MTESSEKTSVGGEVTKATTGQRDEYYCTRAVCLTMFAARFVSSTAAASLAVETRGGAPRRARARGLIARTNASGGDSSSPPGDISLLEVSSVSELQDLIKKTKKENRIAVLEVRRTKASPAVEAFAEKYEGMADEFKDRAVFATLLQDKTEATKLAAKSLNVEEVPEFFIYKDGELVSELASGTSYEGLHHAVARSLGQIEDVG
jgi:hypothetical protein